MPSHSHRWCTVVLLDGVRMITSRAPLCALQIKKRWIGCFFLAALRFGCLEHELPSCWELSCWKRKIDGVFQYDFNFRITKKHELLIRECPLKWAMNGICYVSERGPHDHCNFCAFSVIWGELANNLQWIQSFEWVNITHNSSSGISIFAREKPRIINYDA